MPRRSKHRAPERGLTLIEISIGLVIVALLMAAALPAMEAITGAKAREAAGQIAGTIRYLYGASALSGKACRMVFDMEERSTWAECAEGRFALDREVEKDRGQAHGDKVERKKKAEHEGLFSKESDELKAEQERAEREATFSEFSSEEVKKRTLPDGVTLKVWTAHQPELFTKGQAFLYFFPQGFTEKARIYVSHGGDVYTLAVSGLNGHVKVVPKELEVPSE